LVPRDAQIVRIETFLRQAIRDAVNRPSRKPLTWGGLNGYQQLSAIAQALDENALVQQSAYLRLLSQRVERVLSRNRHLAEDVQAAHQGLVQITKCLHYPRPAHPPEPITSQQVSQAMEDWIQHWHPLGVRRQAQISLGSALLKRWRLYSLDLLPCYDLSHLPQDNLQLEACFGRLRRHQRRITGQRSTRPLQDFGQVQVLFQAENFEALLRMLQKVPLLAYRSHHQRLLAAEHPRQFLLHLHRDPLPTIQSLLAHLPSTISTYPS
jgi:hypothetical protein